MACALPVKNAPQGIYLIKCSNLSMAVVGWTGRGDWEWGQANHCCASTFKYMGRDIHNISVTSVKAAATFMLATPPQLSALGVHWDTVQALGNPFSISPTGKITPNVSAGNAQPAGITGGTVESVFSSIVDAIETPLDFLKWIAWIFHPVNILRGVEFLTGGVLMAFGFHTALKGSARSRRRARRSLGRGAQRTSSGIKRTVSNVASVTPAGRVAREARGRRAGKRSARRAQNYREYDRGYRQGRRKTERKQQRRGKGPKKKVQ